MLKRSLTVRRSIACFSGAVLCLVFAVVILFSFSCQDHHKDIEAKDQPARSSQNQKPSGIPFCYEGISELKRGDFLVKSNLNILPGTSAVPYGFYFGHAAIVTKGAMHENTDSLLAKAELIESTARDLPPDSQVRETAGYIISNNPILHNDSFGPEFRARRYRLRMHLTEQQIESIIQFAVQQKGDLSSWNAQKSFPDNGFSDISGKADSNENWANNSYWYCSLLIWQSVFYATGIDLDPNGGYLVYPNDLINSPYFNNSDDGVQRRVLF